MTTPEPATLESWLGRTWSASDTISSAPLSRLAATLDLPAPDPGAPIPPLWHWLFCLPNTPTSSLGPDGHEARGEHLPDVGGRRLFAGGAVTFHRPLFVGDTIECTSRISDIVTKHGRTGPLVFVTVTHQWSTKGHLAIAERQDIVYAATPPAPPVEEPSREPPTATLARSVRLDSVVLFRFSALTFNAHRIHYDHTYTIENEAYPRLVVQGPLVALLLALLSSAYVSTSPHEFRFRGHRPFFVDTIISLRGTPRDGFVDLGAYTQSGTIGMEATYIY